MCIKKMMPRQNKVLKGRGDRLGKIMPITNNGPQRSAYVTRKKKRMKKGGVRELGLHQNQ